MIRIILIFILLLVSVWLGIQLHHDAGYVLIAINKWTIETTLSIAIPVLVLFFVVLHALLLTLHWIAHIPTAWKNWRAKRRLQKAQTKTRQGLIEFSEGHWLRAKNHLINALPDTETPLLNYLTAARAAQEMGDSKLRDDYLRDAQQSMPEAKIAVELTQAQLQLANHQWEQALATLRHLQDLAPNHPYVLKLLMHLYKEVRDWPQLIELLPALKRHGVVVGAAFDRLQQQAYLQAILDLIKLDQPQPIKEYISNLPKNLRNDSEIIGAYSSYLLKNKAYFDAEALLRRSLNKQFNEQLIVIYGQIGDGQAKLDFVESLLKHNPQSSGLYLSLGRICKANHLWGKAKTYIEESIKLKPSAAAFAELGNLLDSLNDHPNACNAYRQGLLLIIE